MLKKGRWHAQIEFRTKFTRRVKHIINELNVKNLSSIFIELNANWFGKIQKQQSSTQLKLMNFDKPVSHQQSKLCKAYELMDSRKNEKAHHKK